AAPPTDGELTAGGAVGMAGVDAGAPDVEVEEGEEAAEEEPETVASDGSREGEAPDRPSEDSPSLSLDEAYEKMFGAKPDTDQAAFILGLVQELQTAPPERAAQARAILAG